MGTQPKTRARAAPFAVGVAVLAGAIALALPSGAGARPLVTGFADALYTDPVPGVRQAWLQRTAAAGAGVVRLQADWGDIAPTRPADPTDPSDPAYRFAAIDAGVRDAAAHGLEVLLTVGRAPAWAEGPGRPALAFAPAGTWLPDPDAFGDLGQAVARRYSGSFSAASGQPPLPRVRYLQAWNEPNLYVYLTPQYDGRKAVSPAHYRRMLSAFYRGVKDAGAGARVVTAGTAPYGARRGQGLIRPLRFWRALVCVRRRGLRPRRCRGRVRFDIAAHHPITGRPGSRPEHADDATIPDLKRVRAIVRAGERSGRIRPRRRRRPLWVTELWWTSNPPSPTGIPLARQARYIEQALHLIWKQGIRVAILLQVRDAPLGAQTGAQSLQSGVFFVDGQPKPSLTAARFPFVTERRSRRRLAAWGRSPATGRLRIERRRHGRWRALYRRRVSAGKVFTATLPVRGRARLRATVGGEASLTFNRRR